jgi:Polyketide cyclase / dehydrase and lipid transport
MRRYSYETNTAVSADRLFRAKTDIQHWPDWDDELEATAFDAPLAAGSPFMLKPKGGPKVSMRIEEVEAPRRFVDMALLPLAKMRTSTEFLPSADGTRIHIVIEVFGPLAFLWDRIVARKLAADCEQQTRAFIVAAERRP